MGIRGLLPLLKSIQKHCTLKKFSGQTIGVDAYGWLHRGVAGCAFALALDKPTTIHIDFVLSRVRMLLDFGVTPYLVFDGDNLPSKAATNEARRKRREESRTLGMELHKAGKTSQAQQELLKAVDVTPLMARQLIDELKKLGVQYVVAPYEADAQLVYLEQKGIINGILSEDSDLLVFGAKRLLTKLNQYGELVEVERAELAMCKEINLAGWTDAMFRTMAILSGCDYLSNISKLGLKTAHAHVRKHNDIEKILRIVQLEGKLIVPAGYLEQFRQAEQTFLYHRVFCPLAQEMVFLNDLAPGMVGSDMPYLGPHVEPETAIGVACGDLDPFSKRPLILGQGPASRPALGERRRQTYAQPSDSTAKKSIDTFFRTHRQPLAELDPNSLTPSPTQQQLLQRNRNASWEPRLISSAPALRRSVTTSVGSSVSIDRSNFLARASTLSTYQPPKRQRLCSDAREPTSRQEVKRSPFFSAKTEEASPLAQKASRGKKPRKSGFEVFSDEDLGITPAEPGIQQAASPDRGVAAPTTPRSTYRSTELQELIPQSSPAPAPSPPTNRPASGPRVANGTAEGVSRQEDPEAFEDLLDYHVRKQNEALMKSFAYQPSHARVVQPPVCDAARLQTFAAQSKATQRAALEKLPKSSGLNTFCQKLSVQQTFAHQTREIQRSALRSLDKHRSTDDARPGMDAAKRDEGEHRETEQNDEATSKEFEVGRMRGSEDAIVPNSEDENSETGSPSAGRKFDLSSFAFVPA